MVKIENLSFGYNSGKILDNVNLHVRKKEFVSIIGHNGSGKTTLIKLIIGLLRPELGNVCVNGLDIHSFKGKKIRTSIGYINQGSIHTKLPITVLEVLNIGCINKTGELKNIIDDILNLLGISELKNRLYKTLSGGQKQKVNIARCLAQEPKIMLLDEPNSFLDYTSQTEIMEILKKLNREKEITIVMVSHNIRLVKEYSDKIYLLENLELKQIGENVILFPDKVLV